MGLDVHRVEREGIYEARSPVAEIFQDLERLKQAAAATAALRGRLGRFGVFGLLLGMPAIVVGSSTNRTLIALAGGVVTVTAIGLLIYAAMMGRRLTKYPSRTTLLRHLLGMFQQDAAEGAPFAIQLALRGRLEKIKEEPWAARKRGKQQFFRERFLTIEGQLLDGTTFTERIVELSRKRTYVNPRGKYKSKTRSRYVIVLRLAYPRKTYGDATAAHKKLNEKIRMPGSANFRGIRVSDKAILVKALVRQESELVEASVMLSLGAYRILNLARRSASAAKGGHG